MCSAYTYQYNLSQKCHNSNILINSSLHTASIKPSLKAAFNILRTSQVTCYTMESLFTIAETFCSTKQNFSKHVHNLEIIFYFLTLCIRNTVMTDQSS